jgi:DNA-binding XRE family transcriptional regulator
MKQYGHDEILNKYVGQKGTTKRDQFDQAVRVEVEAYRIGEAIKTTRLKQHLTQDQLGALVGVQKAQISKIESGRSITYATIVKVFKALGATSASMDLGHLGRVDLW